MQNPLEIQEIKKKYDKIIYVDIDSTIGYCPYDKKPDGSPDYSTCTPYPKRIAKINKLYDEGNYIVYWTARGSFYDIDWTELTTNQLNEWGCKYHKLILRKPYYDLFIDDKNINSEEYFKDC